MAVYIMWMYISWKALFWNLPVLAFPRRKQQNTPLGYRTDINMGNSENKTCMYVGELPIICIEGSAELSADAGWV